MSYSRRVRTRRSYRRFERLTPELAQLRATAQEHETSVQIIQHGVSSLLAEECPLTAQELRTCGAMLTEAAAQRQSVEQAHAEIYAFLDALDRQEEEITTNAAN